MWSAGRPNTPAPSDYYMAVAYTVRDRILARFMHTIHTYMETAVRAATYLSAEFLIGSTIGQQSPQSWP